MSIESKCSISEGFARIELEVRDTEIKLLESEEDVMRVVRANVSILERLSLRERFQYRVARILRHYDPLIPEPDAIAEEIILDLAGAGVNLERLEEPKQEGGEES